MKNVYQTLWHYDGHNVTQDVGLFEKVTSNATKEKEREMSKNRALSIYIEIEKYECSDDYKKNVYQCQTNVPKKKTQWLKSLGGRGRIQRLHIHTN